MLPISGILSATPIISGALLFVLAVAGALGMVLVLPGRKEDPVRKMGAAVLVAVGIIFCVLVGRAAGGMGVYFWIFSTIAIVGAVRVISHPKPVYSALYFILTVMASAGLFVLMSAEFMAAALVLIYAGAILITYVFVIMLAAEAAPSGTATGVHVLAEHDAVSREPVVASALGFALLGVLLFVILDRADSNRSTVPQVQQASKVMAPAGSTLALGEYLFTGQLVNMELAGLILTVAMVGAIVIARKRIVSIEPAGHVVTETVAGPATPLTDDPHSIPVTGTENPRQKAYPET